MRLIDADRIKNDIMNIHYNCVGMRAGKVVVADFAAQYREDILAIIDEQPTAYDIDKVVEQLEKESYDSCHIDLNTPINRTWQIIDLDDAIEIVKGGAE